MKRFFTFTCRVITLIVLLVLIAISLTPYLLTSQILPQLLHTHGIEGINVKISYITPWTLTGSIQIRNATQQTPFTSHYTLNYHPAKLVDGRIDSIVIDSAILRLAQKAGKVEPNQFSFPNDNQQDKPEALHIPPLPLIAESLILHNCQILFEKDDHTVLPFTVNGNIKPHFSMNEIGHYTITSVQADLFGEGLLPFIVTATLTTDTAAPSLKLLANISKLSGISFFLPDEGKDDRLQIDGTADLSATLLFSSDLSSVTHVNAQLQFPELQLNSGALKLASDEQNTLILNVEGDGSHILYSLENIHVLQPNSIHASTHGEFTTSTAMVKGTGELQADILELPTVFSYQGTVLPNHKELTVQLLGEKQKLQLGTSSIQLGPHQLSVRVKQEDGQLLISEKSKITSLHIPEINLRTGNITSEIPFVLEGFKQEAQPGNIIIDKIRYKNSSIAGLKAILKQDNDGLKYTGELTSHRSGPIRLKFSGTSSSASPLDLTFNIPRTSVNRQSLPSFISLPKDLDFSAKFTANGAIRYDAKGIQGQTRVSVSDGELSIEEKKIKLTGINTDITFPALPRVFSRPRQELQIAAMDIGNLKFSNGKISFRIDNQDTIFIEKSRFTWCKGKVESGSLQLSLTNPELSTILYCDRLQFSELLRQIGISETEGDGSLNGRLPLHFTGKEMVLDDGFLFSTPGNSGIVHFNNTTMLRQGLPDMGQAGYLDYSMQAMENFSYNWTKLTFNSSGEDLLISMQIDGKPAVPLPFGYRKGHIVARPQGQGIQHPIRLDVNFHLPFNQMFKYGQNLQQIMENMQ